MLSPIQELAKTIIEKSEKAIRDAERACRDAEEYLDKHDLIEMEKIRSRLMTSELTLMSCANEMGISKFMTQKIEDIFSEKRVKSGDGSGSASSPGI